MTWYFYRVVDATGAVRSAARAFDHADPQSVREVLEQEYEDGAVLSVRQIPALLVQSARSAGALFGRKLKDQDLVVLLRDLAVLAKAGVPIIDAVRTLADDAESVGPACAAVAAKMLADLRAGATLGEAFDRQPSVFPEPVRNLIRLGDATGAMDRMLQEAADHVERLATLKADSKQALIYPAFVFTAIFGAAGFWLYYVVPNLASLFKQFSVKLPALTVAVIGTSEWVSVHGLAVLLGLVAAVAAVMFAWYTSYRFRLQVYRLLHVLPVSKRLMSASGMAFFAEYFALLLRAGVDIVRSLTVMQSITGDLYYREKLMIVRMYVERGESVSAAMRRIGGFPPLMLRVIAVGEDSGTIDDQLHYLAGEYRTRLTRVVSTLSEILKPVVIFIAGGLMAVFVVALVLPVYDLIGQAMAVRR
ncbi:type II secretion system F family protein [Pseudacidovorax intermedius]|uniref:type II secretion system F family protein n=1 Tax=Pseudacidovorax intermedius TaxID=433924 RepID=UPI0026EC0E90|nr:type II secretion system F family protein [Pseudacidovorax intermedius]